MNISIKPAKSDYLREYTNLLQQTYEKAYTNDELGLTKECFSKEIFNTEDTQKYLKSNLKNNKNQKAWLAFKDSKLVGSITIKKISKGYEVTGFYVTSGHQGKGIGKLLWKKALEFTGNSNILVDLYVHNIKTFEMYKKWGFKIDKTRGENGYFYRHWAPGVGGRTCTTNPIGSHK